LKDVVPSHTLIHQEAALKMTASGQNRINKQDRVCTMRQAALTRPPLELSNGGRLSSFLMAHQHLLGHSVPYGGVQDVLKERRYNQGYLGSIVLLARLA